MTFTNNVDQLQLQMLPPSDFYNDILSMTLIVRPLPVSLSRASEFILILFSTQFPWVMSPIFQLSTTNEKLTTSKSTSQVQTSFLMPGPYNQLAAGYQRPLVLGHLNLTISFVPRSMIDSTVDRVWENIFDYFLFLKSSLLPQLIDHNILVMLFF